MNENPLNPLQESKSAINAKFCYLLLCVSVAIFLIFTVSRIHHPVPKDELYWIVPAKLAARDLQPLCYDTQEKIVSYSPHYFFRNMVLVFKIFGENDVLAHVSGLAYVVFAIILLFYLTKSLSYGDRLQKLKWAALASLLFASNPALIQGALILCNDTTFMIPGILFLFWSFIKYQKTGTTKYAALMSLAIMVVFWSRITTPLALVLILTGYIIINKNTLVKNLKALLAVFLGVLLFIATWHIYCNATGTPFYDTFAYTFGSFQNRMQVSGAQAAVALTKNIVFFIQWFGILPSLLLFAVVVMRGFELIKKRVFYTEDIFIFTGIFIICGYTVVGGAIFGFPKYHVPGIALVYIFTGIFFSRSKLVLENLNLKALIAVIVLSFAIQILTLGDLVYFMRYSLRKAIAFGIPDKTVLIKGLALKVVFFSVLFAVLAKAYHKLSPNKNLIIFLICASIGSNLGVSFLQSTGGYYTNYTYGGRGTLEAAEYIGKRVDKSKKVIIPSEIIYQLGWYDYKHVPNDLWGDTEKLAEIISAPETGAFSYSIITNTIHHIRNISVNPAINEILQNNYEHTQIGDYFIWIRRKPGKTIN